MTSGETQVVFRRIGGMLDAMGDPDPAAMTALQQSHYRDQCRHIGTLRQAMVALQQAEAAPYCDPARIRALRNDVLAAEARVKATLPRVPAPTAAGRSLSVLLAGLRDGSLDAANLDDARCIEGMMLRSSGKSAAQVRRLAGLPEATGDHRGAAVPLTRRVLTPEESR